MVFRKLSFANVFKAIPYFLLYQVQCVWFYGRTCTSTIC
ncbi:hypothetical protein T4C_4473 [Trichinella pseudospiralis]|uniref:Uncharacterized protein n=1 Tax=Trichinella pseudospiralis TaxID=6337 RepID=A0A0V1GHR6_TRIPS|nr:hypothetical protein T4C_4473 [Trichinella pseudospiralis]